MKEMLTKRSFEPIANCNCKIEEMAEIIQSYSNIEQSYYDGKWHSVDVYSGLAKTLYNKDFRIVNGDSVVLSKEEYERLSSSHDIIFCDNKNCPDNLLCRCAEISECPRNIPKYDKKLSANKHKLDLFQKLCKERERADGWEDRYKLLEEELKQSNKETAEKILNEIYTVLWDEKTPIANMLINLDIKIREIATREEVEIKE